MTPKEPKPKLEAGESEEQKLQNAFERLKRITEILKDLYFRILDEFVTIDKLRDPLASLGYPIVRDATGDIRASYSKKEGLRIIFSGGYYSGNPRRQQAENRLREAGLI